MKRKRLAIFLFIILLLIAKIPIVDLYGAANDKIDMDKVTKYICSLQKDNGYFAVGPEEDPKPYPTALALESLRMIIGPKLQEYDRFIHSSD